MAFSLWFQAVRDYYYYHCNCALYWPARVKSYDVTVETYYYDRRSLLSTVIAVVPGRLLLILLSNLFFFILL